MLGSQSVIPAPSPSELPGNLLLIEMQFPGTTPDLLREATGRAQQSVFEQTLKETETL